MKISVSDVAKWPTAGPRGKRADLFDDAGGRAWVGAGGCPGARRGGLFFRRRLDGSGWLRSGVDGDDGFDLVDRNHFCGQETDHNADAVRDTTGAISPPSEVS
jgi:hypothetical protein